MNNECALKTKETNVVLVKDVFPTVKESVSYKLGKQVKNYFSYNIEGKRKRAWELDLIRAILLLFVTFVHVQNFYGLLVDIQTEFGMNLQEACNRYWESTFCQATLNMGVWVFAFLAGINCAFSRSQTKRVIYMTCFAIVYIGVFALIMTLTDAFHSLKFSFNIISIIAISNIVWWIFDIIKLPNWVRFFLSVAIVITGWCYFFQYIVYGDTYVENAFLSMFVYNRHPWEFVADFQPIFPHLGFYILGGLFGKAAYKEKKSFFKKDAPKILSPLLWLGKHSLFTYIMLPTIIMSITLIIEAIVHACI